MAAATFKDVRVRAGAARLVLSDHEGTPNHKTFSVLQASALVSLVGTATLNEQERAEAASLVAAMPWFSPEDCTRVLESLTEPVATSRKSDAKKRRRELQDFTAFLSYGHTDFWKLVSTGTVPAANKLQVICQFLLKLGLRLPTEHTCKLVSSFWMVQAHSADALSALSSAQKMVYLNHVKKTFDNLRKQAGDPMSWIERLPTEPLEMCQQFPGIFNGTFHSGLQPIISPIDLSTVIAVDQSYGCRGGTRSKLQMPDSSTAAAFGINSNKDGVMQLSPRRHESSLERVASQMMGQMQQMASSQQRMFEMFLGTGQPSNLRSLTTMAGSGFLEDRPPQQRPTQAALQAPPLPAPVQDRQLMNRAAPSLGVLALPDSENKPAEVETEDDLQKMLDAMQERKRDTALAAKAAALAAKAPAEKKVPAGGSEAAQPVRSTSKATRTRPASQSKPTKDKTAAAPTEVTTPKLSKKRAGDSPCTKEIKASGPMKVPPNAKASSPAEVSPKARAAKATSPKEVSPKAKAMASVAHFSGKEKTDARAIAVQGAVVLGCAKCRFFWQGCGQCRSPHFNGFRWNAFVK